jgi:hypothetical protein
MSDPGVLPTSQRLCTHALKYQRYHAGFSNQGYLYCDRDDTVLTWGPITLTTPVSLIRIPGR